MNRVVIVGAGASGMMAAIAAANQGAEVTLLEQESIPGRKILATGNGKCNYTNEYMELHCFRGDNGTILPDILQQFNERDTIAFFQNIGVLPTKKNGYVYPISGQAQTIQEVLWTEITERKNITLRTGITVFDIVKHAKEFRVSVQWNETKEVIKCDNVILACGSRAASHLGSNGSGYSLAKKMGHILVPVVPALVQLRSEGIIENHLKLWSGVRIWANVKLFVDKKEVCQDTGEVQLTDYGISGIPVFQVSRFAAYGLREGKPVQAVLSFLPEHTKEEVITLLQQRKKQWPNRSCKQLLAGMIHSKLIPVLLDLAGIESLNIEKINAENGKKKKEKRKGIVVAQSQGQQVMIFHVSDKAIEKLAEVLTNFKLPITGTNDFDQAQICAGGVDTTQVTKHMESKLVNGLYFAGEILDVDGICGGYNLQWAWSTGWIAGTYAGSMGRYDSNYAIKNGDKAQ